MNREKLGKLTVLYDRNRTSAKGFVMYAIKFLLGEGRWRQIMSMCQCNHSPGIAARDCSLHFRRTFRGRVIDLFDFSICLSAFRRTGESPRPNFHVYCNGFGRYSRLDWSCAWRCYIIQEGDEKDPGDPCNPWLYACDPSLDVLHFVPFYFYCLITPQDLIPTNIARSMQRL